jgi:hypothetical protein
MLELLHESWINNHLMDVLIGLSRKGFTFPAVPELRPAPVYLAHVNSETPEA